MKHPCIPVPPFCYPVLTSPHLTSTSSNREAELLIDEKSASAAQKQRVAIVVTHELAHMWFGNLVTMEWWDDLWLNEVREIARNMSCEVEGVGNKPSVSGRTLELVDNSWR